MYTYPLCIYYSPYIYYYIYTPLFISLSLYIPLSIYYSLYIYYSTFLVNKSQSLFSEQNPCIGEIRLTTVGTSKYFFHFMLKLVSCGSLQARKHNNYLCLTLTHLPFIYLSFFKSEWNSSLVSSLSDCQTFQWSHLKVFGVFFFQHVGNFHYFGAAVTFGIPGSFSLPFLVPP